MKKFLRLTAIISIHCAFFPVLAFSAVTDDMRHDEIAYFQAPEDPEKKIEVYPNPMTEGVLTIKTGDQMLSVQILNITGKIVFNAEYQPGTYSAILELSKFEKGIYLIRINFSDKEIHTEKLMVK